MTGLLRQSGVEITLVNRRRRVCQCSFTFAHRPLLSPFLSPFLTMTLERGTKATAKEKHSASSSSGPARDPDVEVWASVAQVPLGSLDFSLPLTSCVAVFVHCALFPHSHCSKHAPSIQHSLQGLPCHAVNHKQESTLSTISSVFSSLWLTATPQKVVSSKVKKKIGRERSPRSLLWEITSLSLTSIIWGLFVQLLGADICLLFSLYGVWIVQGFLCSV